MSTITNNIPIINFSFFFNTLDVIEDIVIPPITVNIIARNEVIPPNVSLDPIYVNIYVILPFQAYSDPD